MHAPSTISSADQSKPDLLAKARGFAESLLGFIAGLEGLVGQFLIPVTNGRAAMEAEPKSRHRNIQDGGISANEFAVHRRTTAPRIIFQHEQHMLTHIRRVEYTLRCFTLWLVAQIIERVTKTGLESFLARHSALQRERYEETYGEGYIPPMIRQQDRELRDNLSDKVRLSSFSVTTPLILSAKRRSKKHRRYRLLPDQLREVDTRFILARIERLFRALKRADVMAERLALRTLQATAQAQAADPGFNPGEEQGRAKTEEPGLTGSRSLRRKTGISEHNANSPELALCDAEHRESRPETSPLRPALNSAVHLPRSTVEESKMQGPEPSSTGLPGEVSRTCSGTEGGATNPLYFQPFQNWLPPPELYESGDEDEREVMNELHFLASSGLKKLGFDPPEPTPKLPDFSVLKPPEHFQEKHALDDDQGWAPVFRPEVRQQETPPQIRRL